MDVIPLLLPLFVLPGSDALTPVDVYSDGQTLMVEGTTGPGQVAQAGDIATIHLTLRVDGGKEIANTTSRGLPYALVLPEFDAVGTSNGSPLVEALQGMRVGSERTLYYSSVHGMMVEDPETPKVEPYILTIRLISVRKPAAASAR